MLLQVQLSIVKELLLFLVSQVAGIRRESLHHHHHVLCEILLILVKRRGTPTRLSPRMQRTNFRVERALLHFFSFFLQLFLLHLRVLRQLLQNEQLLVWDLPIFRQFHRNLLRIEQSRRLRELLLPVLIRENRTAMRNVRLKRELPIMLIIPQFLRRKSIQVQNFERLSNHFLVFDPDNPNVLRFFKRANVNRAEFHWITRFLLLILLQWLLVLLLRFQSSHA